MKSAFNKWFVKQHGNAPTKRTEGELIDEYNKGMAALNELIALQRYNAMKNSALYAWNAKLKAENDALRNDNATDAALAKGGGE